MWSNRLTKSVFLVLALLLTPIESSYAATLVMVGWKACPHCLRFNREVVPDYSANQTGRRVPLREISILEWPSDLKGIRRVHSVPAFILVDNGREVGRFFGYSGEKGFWNNLDSLLRKM